MYPLVLIFVVAFFKGMSDAWSELCLGLTLIDVGQQRATAAVATNNFIKFLDGGAIDSVAGHSTCKVDTAPVTAAAVIAL